MIEASAEEVINSDMSAPAIMAEFSDAEFDDDEAEAETPTPAAQATQQKTEALSEKIRKQKETPKETPAVAVPVTATAATADAPFVPWTDRPGMNTLLNAQKSRVGQAKFDELLGKHSVLMGSLKHDEPKAAALYADLNAVVVGDGQRSATAATVTDDDPF